MDDKTPGGSFERAEVNSSSSSGSSSESSDEDVFATPDREIGVPHRRPLSRRKGVIRTPSNDFLHYSTASSGSDTLEVDGSDDDRTTATPTSGKIDVQSKPRLVGKFEQAKLYFGFVYKLGRSRKMMSRKVLLAWILAAIVAALLSYKGVTLDSLKGGIDNMIRGGGQDAGVKGVKEQTDWNQPGSWKDGPKPGSRLFTDEEIKYVKENPLLLVIVGHVFDVSKGEKHYGPGSQYHGFIGRDGSRAFVTGDFTNTGLISDLEGLSLDDHHGLAAWLDSYFDKYNFVGYHIGRYFDRSGQETEAMASFKKSVKESELKKRKEDDKRKVFPPCNSQWTPETGTKLSCSKSSGGIERSWAGYPHRYVEDGAQNVRCVCIKELGTKNPKIRPYDKCNADSTVCFLGNQE